MPIDVTDRDLGYREVLRQFDDLSERVNIDVGLFDDVDPKVVTYGAANEYGTEHVPARPFLRDTLKKHEDKYFRFVQGKVRAGKGLRQGLEELGPIMVADVRKQRGFEALDPETIEEKGSRKPLVDTGALMGAVSFRVRR